MPDVKKFSGAIKGINFAVNSSKILPVSFKLLDQAVAALKEYPSLRLSIAGHTDNLGKPEKNQTLSQARAEAVRDYLVQKGIDAARIDATGFGDTQPVKDNKTAAGRAANRRIEFKVSAQ
jgi:outer membrane protein OmpA-like peptidoglycan-associated protein